MTTSTDEGGVSSIASEFAEALDQATDASIQVQEVSDLELIRIEINPFSDAALRLEKVIGTAFPQYAGEVTGDALAQEILYGTRQIVALLYVDETTFLLVTRVDGVKLGRALDNALSSDPGLIVNVSVNRSVIELSGPQSHGIIERLAEFEVKPRYFEKGMAFQCYITGAPMMLWRISDDQYLLVPRHAHTAPFIVVLLDEIQKLK